MAGERQAVRIFARWIDDPRQATLAIDVIVDLKTGLIQGEWPVFGAVDLDSSAPQPFLIDKAGIFQFGAGRPPWRSDLRQCRLAVGAAFNLWWTAEDCTTYEIVKIAALGRKDERIRFSGEHFGF